jgi:CheY-like chemotaxis protein
MVYSVINQIKGGIDVASAPRWGTTITLYLPESASLPPLPPLPPPPESKRTKFEGSRTKILLVEDEAMIRRLLARQLQNHGFEVLTAGDGEEAIHVFRQHRASPPLLLISDLVMPGDFSGFDLAAELVIMQPDLKMIFISGYSPDIFNDQVDSSTMFAGKTMRFLPKPFNEAALLGAVEEVMGASQV